MVLKLNGEVAIEDLWGRSPGSADELRALLSRGAFATTDPHRSRFYEIDSVSRSFYVHICPSGKVLLLAVWPKQQSEPVAHASNRPLEPTPA
ncbi:MAG TPA: hypothetical protein VKV79_00245 [Terriglobia bacterium]|nr:hypothetical protein [Terriglobia bacterium]